MMRICVTGGAGFIGRHLVNLLLNKGHYVTIFDNFSNSKMEFVAPLMKRGVNVIEGDITEKNDIEHSIAGSDVVVHLAAKISVSESMNKPLETTKVNVDGTMNILDGCKKYGVKNIILVSSAAVYGNTDSPTTILTEQSNTNPISPYGKDKLLMEQNVKLFLEAHKMNCIIFRVFNVYGEGQSSEYAGVITKFADKILRDEPLVIYGDGKQTRDFVAVEDVVSIIDAAISVSGKYGRIYNIGYGKSTTIENLAKLMLNITRKNLDIKFVKQQEGEIRYSQTSIQRATNELMYLPKIRLEDGIKKFLYKRGLSVKTS
ncbi:MAG: NAD-dependent epimerase/dehydratase family protein [Candidatus Nitrosotenuis sp.]